MKRAICIMSCVSLILFSGCENASPVSRVSGQPTGAKDVIESQIAAVESSVSSETTSSLSSEETTVVTESLPEASADEEFDIDLTIDNADLIYAEVFAMVYTPEDYVGKTVKMKGQFVFYYDEEKDQYYYASPTPNANHIKSFVHYSFTVLPLIPLTPLLILPWMFLPR